MSAYPHPSGGDGRMEWIQAAVRFLNKEKSWTGRIHIQKLLYLTKQLGNESVPFQFRFHFYGPYSESLDEAIREAADLGILAEARPQPGYGPSYSSSSEIQTKAARSADFTLLEKVASKLGAKSSSDLELIATAIWVLYNEKPDSSLAIDAIAERVRELKPRYAAERVNEMVRQAMSIREELSC